MGWAKHFFRVGSHSEGHDVLPALDKELDTLIENSRKRIEPWLSAVFQSEHLNLLLGSGFTTAVALLAGTSATGMGSMTLNDPHSGSIKAHAAGSASRMNRGTPNLEDEFRSALALLEGFNVIDAAKAASLKAAIDVEMKKFLDSLLKTEEGIATGKNPDARQAAAVVLQSFLLSFASRTASRERLHILTLNYDRLIEYGCDLAGLRMIDRFVGALNPVFRASRVEVDVHYNPPGIRGEPRFMEGVLRLTKLHGSLDWFYDAAERRISRKGIPFGAPKSHTDVPALPLDTVMIYPNAAKDVETTEYPYAELFRDFAAAVCRPNAALVTYGYGFGDDHVNRVLLDMLTIPSTHLVIIAYEADDRLRSFCSKTREAQVSLLIGSHFANLSELVSNYLPKPALDYISSRMADLLNRRPIDPSSNGSDSSGRSPAAVEGL